MIIITGSVEGTSDSIEELLALSLEHVRRSRTEPGCLSHNVHRDAENPLRLVFLERWADAAAIEAHFAVPACRQFAASLSTLSAAPTLEIYDAQPRTPTRAPSMPANS